jgi:BASS family bile acid:Na+ symporter
MARFRSFVLPIAILLGLLLHTWCDALFGLVPYLIFSILLLNFAAVDLKKLRMTALDGWLIAFQIIVSLGGYYLIRFITHDETLAQGLLIGVLCPVASSVVVISSILGANRATTTAFTIFGNLMVALVAPIYFSFIGLHQDMPFWDSFMLIFCKIAPVIALPYFIALALQMFAPHIKSSLSRFKDWTFYFWALALLLTLGQTLDHICNNGTKYLSTLIGLGIISAAICAIQFSFGKWLGTRYGDRISGGQLLAQKNTCVGIWMANTYLNPISSVFLAFYSVWQNVFNSWQMWQHDHKAKATEEEQQ